MLVVSIDFQWVYPFNGIFSEHYYAYIPRLKLTGFGSGHQELTDPHPTPQEKSGSDQKPESDILRKFKSLNPTCNKI